MTVASLETASTSFSVFLMNRDEGDQDVAVRKTESLQTTFADGVKHLSFDRGFHSPENQIALVEFVDHLCLPKPAAKRSVVQQVKATEKFLSAQ